MPSANEECRKRSYTFETIDEIVLTIEEHLKLQLELPALQRMPSVNEECRKKKLYIQDYR